MSEQQVEVTGTVTVRVVRAPKPHDQHDPALTCRPAEADGMCHLIEEAEGIGRRPVNHER